MNLILAFVLKLVKFLAIIGSFPFFIADVTTRFVRKIIKITAKFILKILKIILKAIRVAVGATIRFLKRTVLFIKKAIFNKFVLFGIATLLLLSTSYELGLREGKFLHQKEILEQREASPLKVFDRNGTLLYSTTVGTFETTAPSATEYKRAPDFVLFVLQSLTKQFGSKVFDNGVFITTTLDMKLQTAAQEAVLEQVIANDARDGSVIVVNAQNGDILAMVNSIHYFDQPSQPLAVQNKYAQVVQNIQTKQLNPFLSLIDKNAKALFSKKIEVVTDIDESIFKSIIWNQDENTVTTVGNYIVQTSLIK